MNTVFGIYIHYPYCDIKCAYCDFASQSQKKISPAEEDILYKAIEKDFHEKNRLVGNNHYLASIYFGGGTPSKASPHFVEKVLKLIENANYKKLPRVEITLEANPESITKSKMLDFKSLGINRLNIGIQTRNRNTLKYLGRLYSFTKVENVLTDAIDAGFENYGIDLIYGVPGQRIEHLEADIDWAISFHVKHISAYSLMVEPETALEAQIELKEKAGLSSTRQARHQQFIQNRLAANNFYRYEVSNYSLPGYESLHNRIYWQYRPYMGLGPAAHSFLGNQRMINNKEVSNYLQQQVILKEEAQTIPDIFISSLRLGMYQSFSKYRKRLSSEQFNLFLNSLKLFQSKKYLKIRPNGFKITAEGLNWADYMINELFS